MAKLASRATPLLRSTTSTAWPSRTRYQAVVSPAIPAPSTVMCMVARILSLSICRTMLLALFGRWQNFGGRHIRILAYSMSALRSNDVSVLSATSSHPRLGPTVVIEAYWEYAYALFVYPSNDYMQPSEGEPIR
ncbi:hypothetical protein PROAA_770001 [Candidatus Propionivibrio aalborgensis]|uniref:Uncharacterized protein n=1 Tax=Candidatus Propionivibrio aalborgensis TaxID=1860101 RepID=A0A1A8Y169_9RHOO|nr:hypothetical protein PROAA_770001 [Candidatus Propionivibrio aalborgensis]